MLAGCPELVPESVLAQARQLGDEHKWDEARPFIKAYLLDHPEDVSGHFLLGRSYLGLAKPYLTQSIGELRMAETLTLADGALGVFSDQSREEFLSTIYQEIGRTHMRRVYEGINFGISPVQLKGFLEEALASVKRGLELQPDSGFMKEMEKTLLDLLVEVDGVEPEVSERRGRGVV